MPDHSTTARPAAELDRDPHGLGALLNGAVAGDRSALDALLTTLRPYLHALVRARLGQEPSAALDQSALVQEGLIRIYQNISRLREVTVPHLLGWVGQIVRNLVTDAMRARQREPARMAGPELLDQLVRGLPDEDPDRRDRRALCVAGALTHLPERRRQVIELSFLENLSDAEISRRLGGSVGAVRVVRFRALQDLRRLLEVSPDSDCRPCASRSTAHGDDR
jgi:RNA polymerase sigma-70 factor (ECF subfamily)